MEEFIKTFLSSDSLSYIFTHTCNSSIGYVSDPITDTLCTMIKTPICTTLTTKGLMMFRQAPNITLPYSHMNKDQKKLLMELLSEHNQHNVTVSKIQNSVNVTFKCETRPEVYTDVSNVLLCACTLIMDEVKRVGTLLGEDEKLLRSKGLSICNIILQRVRSVTHIKHDVFVHLYADIHDMFPDIVNDVIQKDTYIPAGQYACKTDEACERRAADGSPCLG